MQHSARAVCKLMLGSTIPGQKCWKGGWAPINELTSMWYILLLCQGLLITSCITLQRFGHVQLPKCKVGLFWCKWTTLARCPSGHHNDLIWAPAGIKATFTGWESSALTTDQQQLLSFPLLLFHTNHCELLNCYALYNLLNLFSIFQWLCSMTIQIMNIFKQWHQ